MNKKKVFLTVLALILVCSLSVAGTLAFLTASQAGDQAVVNTFVAAGGGVIINPDGPSAPTIVEPNNVTLQKGFFLVETKAEYDPNTASYKLGSGNVITNTYDKVVPGMVIPKDPKLTVDINTGVDAYVFIRVVNTTNGNLTCPIDTNIWKSIGNSVYVYESNSKQIINGAAGTELNAVPLFADSDSATDKTLYSVTAADTLQDTVTDNASDSQTLGMQLGELKFFAYACQAGGFADATAAYNACFGS